MEDEKPEQSSWGFDELYLIIAVLLRTRSGQVSCEQPRACSRGQGSRPRLRRRKEHAVPGPEWFRGHGHRVVVGFSDLWHQHESMVLDLIRAYTAAPWPFGEIHIHFFRAAEHHSPPMSSLLSLSLGHMTSLGWPGSMGQ